jgi:hypothetical protein
MRRICVRLVLGEILQVLGALVVVEDGQRHCLMLQQQQQLLQLQLQVVPVGLLAVACVLLPTYGALCWCLKALSYSQQASRQLQGQLMVLLGLMQDWKQQQILRQEMQVTTVGVDLWAWVAVPGACISSSSSHGWCSGTPTRHQAAAAQDVQVSCKPEYSAVLHLPLL